jgi:hypothetical protein
VKDHRTTLLSLVSLRPNDAVSFNVFKYGIQAILLAKGRTQEKIYFLRDIKSNVRIEFYEIAAE